MDHTKKLAVLIDADNASPSIVDALLAEVANYGIASVKRIYGDWTAPGLRSWKDVLLDHSIQPIQQFAYTKGKNATDSAMIIDAMDLLFSDAFDGFCLVSSDSDFTKLASRIRESGLAVYGFGEQKTPAPFVAACDKFIYTVPMVVALIRSCAIDEVALVGALRREMRIPLTDPATVTLDSDALRVLPRDVAWRQRVLPLGLELGALRKRLVVAVADPTDAVALAEVEHVSDCHIEVTLMPLSAIEEMIESGYRKFITRVLPRTGEYTTAPHRRVPDEATTLERHRAMVELLVEKGIFSRDEYDLKVEEILKRRSLDP